MQQRRWAWLSFLPLLFARQAAAAPPDATTCLSTLAETGRSLENKAMFEEAADAYAAYARSCVSAPDAPRALARAVELRFGLDQEESAQSEVRFFRQHFARAASVELDRVTFAHAYHALQVGDVRAVLASWPDADRVLPERRFERRVLLLEAQAELVGRAPIDRDVRQLMDEWNRLHPEHTEDLSALSATDRAVLTRLGSLAADVLCHERDPDLVVRHPMPGKMKPPDYMLALGKWLRRRKLAVTKRETCLRSGVLALNPGVPAPALAVNSVAITRLYTDLRAEFMQFIGYRQVREYEMQQWTPFTEYSAFDLLILEFDSHISSALEWCVRLCNRQYYAGDGRAECDRTANLLSDNHRRGIVSGRFDFPEMVPPLRNPLVAVVRPAPAVSR